MYTLLSFIQMNRKFNTLDQELVRKLKKIKKCDCFLSRSACHLFLLFVVDQLVELPLVELAGVVVAVAVPLEAVLFPASVLVALYNWFPT